MARVAGAEHVLGIERLLHEVRGREGAVRLGRARGERGEARHEEVEARERDEVHCELAEVA